MSTFSKAKLFIKTCEEANRIHEGVREILTTKPHSYLKVGQKKQLQQLADEKFEELKRKEVMERISEEALEQEMYHGQLPYLLQRAKNHTENFMYQKYIKIGREVPLIPDIVYKAMAIEFLERQRDCNLPTYDVWQEIVCDFLDDAA